MKPTPAEYLLAHPGWQSVQEIGAATGNKHVGNTLAMWMRKGLTEREYRQEHPDRTYGEVAYYRLTRAGKKWASS